MRKNFMAIAETSRYYSIGNVAYADPTANEAIANLKWRKEDIFQQTASVTTDSISKSTPRFVAPTSTEVVSGIIRKQDLSDMSHALAWLKSRRKSGALTRTEYTDLHKPLAAAYNELLIAHINRTKGGK